MGHALGVSYDATSADVWMNGEYQGLYTVTPKTDSYVPSDGYLIEEDNYKEPSVAEGGDPQFELEGLHGQNGNWASVYNLITVKQLGSNLKNIYGSEDAAIDAMRAWQTAVLRFIGPLRALPKYTWSRSTSRITMSAPEAFCSTAMATIPMIS